MYFDDDEFRIRNQICIVVFGNIGSGKTTFCKHLKPHLKRYDYVCLDEFRYENQFNMSGFLSEKKSKQQCMDAIMYNNYVLYETTGVTEFYDSVKANLLNHGSKVFYVHIKCHVEECRIRVETRPQRIFLPYKNKTIYQILEENDRNLKTIRYDLQINSSLPLNVQIKTFIDFYNSKIQVNV